jgi:hypothetical protein
VQTPPELAPYEGRPIHEVRFVGAGDAEKAAMDQATLDLITNQLRLKAGMPFSAELAGDDIGRLNRLGRFKRVESGVQMLGDGSVDLIYTLGLQPIIRSVQTVGNKTFSDQELGRIIDVLEGTPVDPTRLDRSCRRIEDKYRERGFYNCLVTVDEKELVDNNIVPLDITYEQLTHDMDATVRLVMNHIDSPIDTVPAPQTKKQSDATSKEWAERFVLEHPEHAHRANVSSL